VVKVNLGKCSESGPISNQGLNSEQRFWVLRSIF